MRLTAGLLIVVSTGVFSQALADDPTPAPQAPSQTAPPPAEQPRATAPGGEHSAPAPTGEQHAVTPAAPTGEQHAVTPAATPKAGTEVTREDQDILSRGYKLEMRHGEKYFCRREGEIGSHFEKKACYTAASLEAQEAASKEMTRRIQINTPQSGK